MSSIHNLAVLIAATTLAGCASMAEPGSGLVAVKSPYSATETASRLETQLKQRNLAVVARVDRRGRRAAREPDAAADRGASSSVTAGRHAADAVCPGRGHRPADEGAGRVDAQQQVWLGYNDPMWLVRRHGGGDCPAAENVRKALAAIAEATVAR